MTEHSKIPLPGGPGSVPARNASLLERASGSFGLDAFRPAPMPATFDQLRPKRAGAAPRDAAPRVAAAIVGADTQEIAPAIASGRPAAVAAPHPRGPAVRLGTTLHPVDRQLLKARGMIVPEDGATALLEEFRIVKRQVLSAAQAAGDPRARRVLICSPHPGEGKTFCAINLAIAMAGEKGGELLLVDADFAKPSVPATLGLARGPGLMDALADPGVRVEDLVMATDIPGLFVLPAGSQSGADSEWLASARTAEVLDRLTRDAPRRMVVFDSPPVLAASPAAELAKHVGQALLLCRADRTGQSALEDSIQLLSACPDIKLLLNAAHFSPSGRTFGSYYGYGE